MSKRNNYVYDDIMVTLWEEHQKDPWRGYLEAIRDVAILEYGCELLIDEPIKKGSGRWLVANWKLPSLGILRAA